MFGRLRRPFLRLFGALLLLAPVRHNAPKWGPRICIRTHAGSAVGDPAPLCRDQRWFKYQYTGSLPLNSTQVIMSVTSLKERLRSRWRQG